MTKRTLKLWAVLLGLQVTLLITSCSTLQREFYSPPGTTNAPPIASQLRQGADLVGPIVPAPYGTIIAALMNLAATGAAAFATFHARNAAVATAATANALPNATPTPKT